MDASLLNKLITCKKEVIQFPGKGYKEEFGHKKLDFNCQADQEGFSFRVFIRQSLKFQEDFSVGLVWQRPEGLPPLNLYRCNGLHGGAIAFPHHAHFHIHTLNLVDIQAGRTEPRMLTITDAYDSLPKAIFYFAEQVNILDIKTYFPPPQPQLFADGSAI
jgi:hypothetical protein